MYGDEIVKCCRCRNQHKFGERIELVPDNNGLRSRVCPRCSCKTLYRLEVEKPLAESGTHG